MISDSSCSESKSTLQIPDGCSQTTVCKSLREKMVGQHHVQRKKEDWETGQTERSVES